LPVHRTEIAARIAAAQRKLKANEQ
jgi:hypothetical protein